MAPWRVPTRTSTTRITVRLSPDELAALDAEVAEGEADSRSDAMRRSIARLRRDQRYRAEERVLVDLARRGEPVHPDLEGLVAPHPALG